MLLRLRFRARTTSQHVQIGDGGQIYRQNHPRILLMAKSIILSCVTGEKCQINPSSCTVAFKVLQEKKTCTHIRNPKPRKDAQDEWMETAELFTVTELVQPSCPCCSVFIAHGHRCACVVFARVSSRVLGVCL